MTLEQTEIAGAALRLLIADDQPLIRRALAMILASEPGIEVVGQAADGIEAIEMALATSPDVVIMDLQMPRASGVVATREITAQRPNTRVVVLTTFDHDDLVFDAIRAGAQAYLLKDASEADVLDTVRAVHRGESRLSPAIARKVMNQFRTFSAPRSERTNAVLAEQLVNITAPVLPHLYDTLIATTAQVPDSLEDPLTDKEVRILALLAQGKSNKQIGAMVFLAEGTVKNYISRIMDKLHTHTRIELAVRAISRRS